MKPISAYRKFLMIALDDKQYEKLDGNPNLIKSQEKIVDSDGKIVLGVYPKGCISSGLREQLNKLIKIYKTGK